MFVRNRTTIVRIEYVVSETKYTNWWLCATVITNWLIFHGIPNMGCWNPNVDIIIPLWLLQIKLWLYDTEYVLLESKLLLLHLYIDIWLCIDCRKVIYDYIIPNICYHELSTGISIHLWSEMKPYSRRGNKREIFKILVS